MPIPKIIHYCWFGRSPEPDILKQYKISWKYFCSDYNFKKWDESNFNLNKYSYTKMAYSMKRYDLVSDYVRLFALKTYGGIYLDTDVELLKSPSPLLINKCFFGLEEFDSIASGLMVGADINNENINNLLQLYNDKSNVSSFYEKNCVDITTEYFREYGFKYSNKLQIINNCTIYPTSYFCPMKYGSQKVKVTKDTYSIHHYKKQPYKKRINIFLGVVFRRLFGRNLFFRLLK